MDLNYAEQQVLLQDGVRKFVERQYGLDVRRRVVGGEEALERANWKVFADLGWLGLAIEPEYGGLGGSAEDSAALMEEFGRGLVVEPFVATALLFGRLVSAAGSAEQKARILPSIAGGGMSGALAHGERQSRHELADILTRAEVTEAGFVVNGEKVVVPNGGRADAFVVSARTGGTQYERNGISLLLVEGSQEGLERRGFRLMDGQPVAHIRFDNVVLPRSSLLGELGGGLPILAETVRSATLDLASEAYGVMASLLDRTVRHVRTREQFGVTIGSFQAVQHRLVDMYVACEEVKSLLFRALCAPEGSDEAAICAHALKYKVGEAGKVVWEGSIQLHGGMGMTAELDVGHYVKRLMMINMALGDADHHLDAFIDVGRLDGRDRR